MTKELEAKRVKEQELLLLLGSAEHERAGVESAAVAELQKTGREKEAELQEQQLLYEVGRAHGHDTRTRAMVQCWRTRGPGARTSADATQTCRRVSARWRPWST